MGLAGTVSLVIALVMLPSADTVTDVTGVEGMLWIVSWYLGAIWFGMAAKN